MRLVSIFAFVAGVGMASSALASPPPAFECPGAGDGQFIYTLGDERYGTTPYPNGPDDILELEAGSGEGTLFVGTKLRFFEASEASGLSSNVQVIATDEIFNCASTAVESNLPGAGDTGSIRGMALETIIRDGPSVDAARSDKLPFKEPVALLRNEGNEYQGYPWFQIEYSEGIRGFAWGGTLCSKGMDVAGVAGRCEDFN